MMLFGREIFITMLKLHLAFLLQLFIIGIGARHRRSTLCCFGGMRGRGPVGGPNGAKRDWRATDNVVTEKTGVRSRPRTSTPSTLS